jgi:hypothetical protein
MRLLKPAPGECADRQTILELKMKYGGEEVPVDTADLTIKSEAEKAEPPKQIRKVINDGGLAKTIARQKFVSGKANIQPFVDEHEMIQVYLEREWFPSLESRIGADAEYDRLLEELTEVNAEIWKLTDRGQVLLERAKSLERCSANDRTAAEVLYGTIEQNNKRAELVGRINQLFGLNVVEKIFA